MKEKRLLCVLMKNNHIYNILSDNTFKQDKNCYIVTKYGSMAHPVISYTKKVQGNVKNNNKVIGGYTELIEFLKNKSNEKVYLRGFNRATLEIILRLLIEDQTNKKISSDPKQNNTVLSQDGLSSECRMAANYIIEEINKYNEGKLYSERIVMHTKKLQKLLYFCDVEYMKEHGGIPMFRDVFYAWPSGPVIPEVYYEYMQYQDSGIVPKYNGINITITEDMKSIIDGVLEEKKELDTVDMIEICNVAGGPWAQVFNAEDENHNQIISKEEMYNFYTKNVTSNGKKRLRKK